MPSVKPHARTFGTGPNTASRTWKAEANANQTKLKSGRAFHPQLFAEAGLDFEDELNKAAEAYAVPVEELRRRLLDTVLPIPQQMVRPAISKRPETPAAKNRPPLRCSIVSMVTFPAESGMAKAKQIIAMSAPGLDRGGGKRRRSKSPAKFVSTFYTGGALNIAGWDLPVVVDLAGLTNGKVLVANLDHNASQRVGNFSVANDGRSLVANSTATAATAARDEVVQSAQTATSGKRRWKSRRRRWSK